MLPGAEIGDNDNRDPGVRQRICVVPNVRFSIDTSILVHLSTSTTGLFQLFTKVDFGSRQTWQRAKLGWMSEAGRTENAAINPLPDVALSRRLRMRTGRSSKTGETTLKNPAVMWQPAGLAHVERNRHQQNQFFGLTHHGPIITIWTPPNGSHIETGLVLCPPSRRSCHHWGLDEVID